MPRRDAGGTVVLTLALALLFAFCGHMREPPIVRHARPSIWIELDRLARRETTLLRRAGGALHLLREPAGNGVLMAA